MNPDESTEVVIHTRVHRIRGRIALLPGARLTDFIRNADNFIAVTGAEVADASGQPLFTASFVDVGIATIELIVPADLVRKSAG